MAVKMPRSDLDDAAAELGVVRLPASEPVSRGDALTWDGIQVRSQRQHLNLEHACGDELDRIAARLGLTREVAPRSLGVLEPDELFRERIQRAHDLDQRNRQPNVTVTMRPLQFDAERYFDILQEEVRKQLDGIPPVEPVQPPPKPSRSRWDWILAGDIC